MILGESPVNFMSKYTHEVSVAILRINIVLFDFFTASFDIFNIKRQISPE